MESYADQIRRELLAEPAIGYLENRADRRRRSRTEARKLGEVRVKLAAAADREKRRRARPAPAPSAAIAGFPVVETVVGDADG